MWKYISGAFFALCGIIFALLGRNRELKDEVAAAKADEALKDVKGKLYEEGKKADAAAGDFHAADDEFKRALADLGESGGGNLPDHRNSKD